MVRVALLAALAGAIPRPVAPPVLREYVLSRPGNFPHDPAVGADGIVWYTDQTNSYIGRLDRATGSITDFPTPTPGSGPHGIAVAPDGGVWYTGQRTGIVGRLDPATKKITEYNLPPETANPHTPIWFGGAVWYTDASNNTYGRLDPATSRVRSFTFPSSGSVPYGIVSSPSTRGHRRFVRWPSPVPGERALWHRHRPRRSDLVQPCEGCGDDAIRSRHRKVDATADPDSGSGGAPHGHRRTAQPDLAGAEWHRTPWSD